MGQGTKGKAKCRQCGQERRLMTCGVCSRELCSTCLASTEHVREHVLVAATSQVPTSLLLEAALEDGERLVRVLRTLVRRGGR